MAENSKLITLPSGIKSLVRVIDEPTDEYGGPRPTSPAWKTSFDVPGGNGITAETQVMQLDDCIDFLMNLARQWGQAMPELKDVDPTLPGIGGIVIDGEHIQGPPRMLAGTMHGDCADQLVTSGAIFEAQDRLKGGPGNWDSPFGPPRLFEQPDAAQDHIAWENYDHMATRPVQLGGWFDTIKKLARKAAPTILRTATQYAAPWATPLLSAVWKQDKPRDDETRQRVRPDFAASPIRGRHRVPQRRQRYQATAAARRPVTRRTWDAWPSKRVKRGQLPRYLPPTARQMWNLNL